MIPAKDTVSRHQGRIHHANLVETSIALTAQHKSISIFTKRLRI